ncbi:MAG: transporter substrate-binding domain-containing protein [Acetobacterium sp.]|nr:transporter substrate-binding domain-containing protein [Bacillota bacterium]MCG2731180.1 transporter substrate-binding domain-containing protein [Acetobacterium sp.]
MKINKKITIRILIMLGLIIGLISLGGCEANKNQPDHDDSAGTQTDRSDTQTSNKILLVTGEYAPYTSPDGTGYGAFTQIVEAVLKESGLENEIAFYPWARASEMVKNGEAWASFPYGYTKELAQSYDYSDAIIQSPHKFYYLKSNEKLAREGVGFTKISDFTNYTFGGANDYWYGDKTTIENSGVTAEWASDTDALLKMLHAGRIDFLIEDQQVADAAIARLFPDDIDAFATLPNSATQQDYYLIISKNYPNSQFYREKFNAALQTLKNNGTIDRILAENGLSSNK